MLHLFVKNEKYSFNVVKQAATVEQLRGRGGDERNSSKFLNKHKGN